MVCLRRLSGKGSRAQGLDVVGNGDGAKPVGVVGVALDEGAQKEMRAYLESAAKAGDEARFDLKAYAGTDTGALSDARRVAYYRAMAVRAELIANGIPALRISVHVLDQTEKTDPHRVQIFTRTKTASGGEAKDLRG